MATITFRPAKDLLITDEGPNDNFNAIGLRTGRTGGGFIRRSLLHFDLSTMPAYVSIDAATLTLRIIIDGIIDVEAYAHRITQTAWQEGSASWNKYNSVASWATPGGDYDPTTPAPVQWFQPSGGETIAIYPLRDHVLDALDNRGDQLHLLLKQADEGFAAGEYRYGDREYDDLTSATYPQLLIAFTRPSSERIIDDPRATLGAARVAGARPAASAARAARPAPPARPS